MNARRRGTRRTTPAGSSRRTGPKFPQSKYPAPRRGNDSTSLGRLGEQGLIEHLRRRFEAGPSSWGKGLGDDCAVIAGGAGRSRDLLLTTDVLVEGVDFDRRYSPFHQVGHKALSVNLSDVAAMGGMPRSFVVAIGAPPGLLLSSLDELYDGMYEAAEPYRVQMIGGDVSACRSGLFVAITVLGEVETGRAAGRGGARVGDQLFVTGSLGDAAAGLEVLRRGGRGVWGELELVRRQCYPVPRIEQGRVLALQGLARAMIDLSDGLASDLRHLCRESGVGAVVNSGAIPISAPLRAYTERQKADPMRYALTGGEDFELLFAVDRRKVPELLRAFRGASVSVSRIGSIVPKSQGIRLRAEDNRLRPFPARGYEHFRAGRGP